MNKFEKYTPYLHMKHDWNGINCITLIENIYQRFLNISLDDMWNRLGQGKQFNKKWRTIYDFELLKQEVDNNWKKISLPNIQEFDIIFIISRGKIPLHFGLYIDQNRFIHVEEFSYCTVSELNERYRDRAYGYFRHKLMV